MSTNANNAAGQNQPPSATQLPQPLSSSPPPIETIPLTESEMELVALVNQSNQRMSAESQALQLVLRGAPIEDVLSALNIGGDLDPDSATALLTDWFLGASDIDTMDIDPNSPAGQWLALAESADAYGRVVGQGIADL
jgi:hypothetical protein